MKKILNYLNLDEYEKKAVFEPAVVNLVLLYLIIVTCLYSNGLTSTIMVNIAKGAIPLAILAITIRFLMNLFRDFSKTIIQYPRYKRNMSNMPTTELLLWSNGEMPKVEKKNIRDKIRTKYEVSLPSEKAEKKDEKAARQLIADVVSRIRGDIRNNEKADKMYLRYNMRYGASRNFFGGGMLCIVAELFFILLLNLNSTTFAFAWFLFALHCILVIIDFFMIPARAKEYASNLYAEFLRLN